MSEPMKLPWAPDEWGHVRDANGKTVRITGFDLASGYVPDDDPCHDVMRLIVKAVNFHERLVEAIRAIIQNEDSLDGEDSYETAAIYSENLAKGFEKFRELLTELEHQ